MDDGKVLVADCHPLVLEGLRAAVRYALPGATVVGAQTLSEAEAKTAQLGRIRMALLDPDLPDARGLLGLLRLQYKLPRVPIVMMLSAEESRITGTARSLGAAGLFLKSAPVDRIADDLRQIAAGRRVFPSGAVPSSVPPIRDRIAQLSDAQRRVLFALAEGHANKQIAYGLAVTEATVKAHLTAIFRQLGVNNRSQAMLALRPVLGDPVN
ncbi:DNA-binding NarL/FixJ family response regulator [Novosphingobium chloroacetimidivorans]|uniref:DNA-binding NarL/FixJ family response regulator n=1 Tax=Novosphingobium chloroacetimidivorans TaxID=1428314 RepID=A0A7W7NYQ5_9SPHN|nr:response regulator transcription factor [Novosphingobium chloroacetimidivorans]MBB4860749.1 DNA-binding NarL/FixJ family response regulator [Novosphingobium chloroacetimidivorans]